MFLMYHINVKNKFKNIILIYFKLSLKKPNTVKKKKKKLGIPKGQNSLYHSKFVGTKDRI